MSSRRKMGWSATTPSGWQLALKVALGVGGVLFMVVAFVKTWQSAKEVARFSPWPIVLSLAFSATATLGAGRSWASLLSDKADSRQLRRDYYLAQPGKYIPGGFAQPLGQVSLARSVGISWGSGSVALAVQVICSIASATLILAVAWIAGSRIPLPVRLMPLGALVVVPLLYRPAASVVIDRIWRFFRRRPVASLLPSQRRTMECFAWTVLSQVAAAIGFWLALSGIVPHVDWFVAIPGFMAAWIVGFVLVPFPAGLGVREALLLLILNPVPAALVVGASAIQRMIVLVGEGLALLISRIVPL